MIDHLHWESLEQRRQKARVIMLYKIIHNEVDINPQSYLIKAGENYTIGSSIPVPNL
jgi:hypothetical protein